MVSPVFLLFYLLNGEGGKGRGEGEGGRRGKVEEASPFPLYSLPSSLLSLLSLHSISSLPPFLPNHPLSPFLPLLSHIRCGVRGGYMELLGFDEVLDEINKLFRTKLCPNTMGQVQLLHIGPLQYIRTPQIREPSNQDPLKSGNKSGTL